MKDAALKHLRNAKQCPVRMLAGFPENVLIRCVPTLTEIFTEASAALGRVVSSTQMNRQQSVPVLGLGLF